MGVTNVKEFKDKVVENVSKVIVGKEEVIELITISFLCGGHALLEDVPGVGKTTLIKAFSRTMGCDFKRIQFTPDLLPSDLTGINFYNQKKQEFEFKEGPLFSNIILADEINRATPRAQSALLEAMEEVQITIDGVTRELKKPFMVLATQNPIESFGTFPLPEAQIDRFFMKLKIGYPSRLDEIEIINKFGESNPLDDLKQVIDEGEINLVKEEVNKVFVCEDVVNYIMDIAEATRGHEKILIGTSPRATLALFKASKARAAVNARDYVIPEDVRDVAPHVLSHRLVLKGIQNKDGALKILNGILNSIAVPVEKV